jgi:ubiquinone/menaquinone biosynthesis C-methylase UbiE
MANDRNTPTPVKFLETINSYQRTAALKAAIELELFTAIGRGEQEVEGLARACGTSARGMRILCDYLTVLGFLDKQAGGYRLSDDSRAFLDRQSPAYLGNMIEFLLSPMIAEGFRDLVGAVRAGGTRIPAGGTTAPDHPVWADFAHAMAGFQSAPAERVAALIDPATKPPFEVLDIAAGHGMYGIAVARRVACARITALDWAHVLEVAAANARAAGLADRYRLLPGSAFEADFGGPYQLALLSNFLHHFDPPTCEGLLRRLRAALAEGGRVITVEWIPNDDRVSPTPAALFALMMLASTPAGDAYTYAELERMFAGAGFSGCERRELEPMPQRVIIARR